jgi:hypothetical protein
MRLDASRGDGAASHPFVQAKASLILHEEANARAAEGDEGVEEASQAGRKRGGVTVVFCFF